MLFQANYTTYFFTFSTSIDINMDINLHPQAESQWLEET